MIKLICAPDSFKESIDAVAAARAMRDGVLRILPEAEIDLCPVGDGGEGTLASLLESAAGELRAVKASNVLGETVAASIGLFDDGKTAFVESAAVIGYATMGNVARNIMRSSSFGVGELILQACRLNPQEIIVGVGGTLTNDAGCGMAQALGISFFDRRGRKISHAIGGGDLTKVAAIDNSALHADLKSVQLVAACDVNNYLQGPDGAIVYAPQKGANQDEVKALEAGLNNIADILQREFGVDVSTQTGAGAGGGLAAGLMALLDARYAAGIDYVLEAVQFERRVRGKDLCLTGEGSFDQQSVHGKACAGVALAASRQQVPSVALVGRLEPGAREAAATVFAACVEIGAGLSLQESMVQAPELLAAASASVAQNYLTTKNG